MLILGIESSCDETAAAVLQNGNRLRSSIVASQVAAHSPYGGVVPELASRKHIEAIVPVVDQAIQSAGIAATDLDGVAVTQGPGLVGSLLVGFSFAKAYAYAMQIPWIGISHLDGHINSVFLTQNPPPFPFVALLVSGGHTAIYHVTSHTMSTMMGQTRDDAAGEAFDKVSKMLGLGYPGGEIISDLAEKGNPRKVFFKRAYLDRKKFDFSFSGLKTGVRRYIETSPHDLESEIADIAAGFQASVVDVLSAKLFTAAETMNCRHLALVGGVAANQSLRDRIETEARNRGCTVHIPPLSLCGDNAAMIAAVGHHHLNQGHTSHLDDDVYSRIKS
jgi:tRNA N6-adenosine threonylcarbamoyltransferase